jgi:hypothetical protein
LTTWVGGASFLFSIRANLAPNFFGVFTMSFQSNPFTRVLSALAPSSNLNSSLLRLLLLQGESAWVAGSFTGTAADAVVSALAAFDGPDTDAMRFVRLATNDLREREAKGQSV